MKHALGLAFLLIPVVLSAQESWTYYSGGQALLSLEALPSENPGYWDLRGKSSLLTVMVEVAGQGVKKNQVIPVNPDGSFAVRFYPGVPGGTYKLTFFGARAANALRFQGVAFTSATLAGGPPTLPERDLNPLIMDWVNQTMGKTVGRGECWDLVQEILDKEGAAWTRPVKFGRLLDPLKDEVRPGDIIQFKTLRLEETLPNGGRRWEILGSPDHTSVVYEVLGPLKYKLAHQNLSGKRFVQVTELDLGKRTSGQYWIYRPEPALLRLDSLPGL